MCVRGSGGGRSHSNSTGSNSNSRGNGSKVSKRSEMLQTQARIQFASLWELSGGTEPSVMQWNLWLAKVTNGSRVEIRWRKENLESGRPLADNCGNTDNKWWRSKLRPIQRKGDYSEESLHRVCGPLQEGDKKDGVRKTGTDFLFSTVGFPERERRWGEILCRQFSEECSQE